MKIGIESKNKLIEISGLNTWANYLRMKGENGGKPNKILIDSCERTYLKVMKIIESNPDFMSLASRDYAKSKTNLAALYIYDFDNKTYKDKINLLLVDAEKINIKNNNIEALFTLNGLKAEYLINQNKLDDATNIYKKLETIAQGKAKTNPIQITRVYDGFMKIAKLKNDFPSFLKYLESYVSSRNEQHKQETNATIYNASVKFETEQKDKEIANLKEIADSRKKINYALIALAVLSLLTLFFMYRTYVYRQKAMAKANELLQKANEEANLLSKLNEEEAVNTMLELEIANRERKMAEQEKLLTEQQKEKLQHELMTNNLQLESKKTILKEVQEKLALIKSTELKQISRTINKSIEVDEEFELLKTSFENANPIFFSTLQEKASSSLTKLDLKYCGYFKLGMGTKEVANIMNIEPKSMRMARYRIRQKLNLNKEVDLDDFINSI